MVMITHEPIDPSATYLLLGKEHAGSMVFHYATVKEQRNHDKTTTGIEYRTNGDTEAELKEIAAELKEKWQLEDVLLIRRIGRLGIGDIISLVATSSPNSEDAFAACRHGIARLKKMAAIRKTEVYG